MGINHKGGSENKTNIKSQYQDGLNLYKYVGNNPVIFLDPQGKLKCCFDSIKESARMADTLLYIPGECRHWFESRGCSTRRGDINMHPGWKPMCLIGAYFWTWPITRDIGACPRACDNDVKTNALLIIHEIAHHCCPLFFGREDCANDAIEACGETMGYIGW